MKYLAIDVETANADYSSICQIGIAEFNNGEVIDTWSTLVNPETYFDPFNISIHGIDEAAVMDAPTFSEIHTDLQTWLMGEVAIHHMPFDRVAISRACLKHELDLIDTTWTDSAMITRRAWPQFARRGYALGSITSFLGITFQHHDALEDAIAAGLVVYEACQQSGKNIEEWSFAVKKNKTRTHTNNEVNPEGSFYGEKIVFTGALLLPRAEASELAANMGCEVLSGVSKKTTMLVVGTQNAASLGAYDKSSKHRKAEDLIKKGEPIRILSEEDFVEMVTTHN